MTAIGRYVCQSYSDRDIERRSASRCRYTPIICARLSIAGTRTSIHVEIRLMYEAEDDVRAAQPGRCVTRRSRAKAFFASRPLQSTHRGLSRQATVRHRGDQTEACRIRGLPCRSTSCPQSSQFDSPDQTIASVARLQVPMGRSSGACPLIATSLAAVRRNRQWGEE